MHNPEAGPLPAGLEERAQRLAAAMLVVVPPQRPAGLPEEHAPEIAPFLPDAFQQQPELAQLQDRMPAVLALLRAARAGAAPGLDADAVAGWLLLVLEAFGSSGLPAPAVRALLELLLQGLPGPLCAEPPLLHLQQRQAFRDRLWEDGLCATPPVSIGNQCFPWTVDARWGFLAGPDAARLTFNPFSLAQHNFAYVSELLRNGWGGYAAPETLARFTSPNGVVVIHRKDGKAWWNHHTARHWQDDGYARLRANLAELGARLDRLLADPPWQPLVFHLAHLWDSEDEACAQDAAGVLAALRARMPGHRPRLFVSQVTRSLPGERDWEPFTDCIIHRRMQPDPAYNWFEPRCYNSPAGFALEHGIAQALREAMLRWRAEAG